MNGYGPSETTVECTNFEVDKTDYTNIPIGKPIDNCKIYIVDQDLNLCPTGIAGELCISGHGVGLGYIHLPEINKEKFIANPFTENKDYSLLFKSGDLAKWLPDGNIEFLGRIDFQVKIRGFRIELGEIEHQLSLFPNIKECIVLSKVIPFGGQYAMNLGVHIEGLSNVKEEIS